MASINPSRVDQPNKRMFDEASIHNVVITTHTNCRLDLALLARNCPNANYDPRRFAAVIIRLREPSTTALMFNTGKVVCTGASSIEDAHAGLTKFIGMLRRLGIETTPAPFTVENIVGASRFRTSTPQRLAIDRMSASTNVEYEPELFPGLSRRFQLRDGTNVMVIVFSSGKMILTGNRRIAHLREVMIHVNKWLSPYIRSNSTPPESAPPRRMTTQERLEEAASATKRPRPETTLRAFKRPSKVRRLMD